MPAAIAMFEITKSSVSKSIENWREKMNSRTGKANQAWNPGRDGNPGEDGV